MPLGSSKFFFRNKTPGSSPPATGYPSWPALPNVTVLTTFLDKFKFESAPVQASQTYSEWPGSLINVNGAGGSQRNQFTATTVPNGNVYLTGTIYPEATGNLYTNHVFVYDNTTDDIVACNASLSIGSGRINSATSSILNPYDNKVWFFEPLQGFATTVEITSGAGTIAAGVSKVYNRFANGDLKINTTDSAFYDQAENNILMVRNNAGPADSKGIYFGMTSGNATHYAIAETSFSDGGAGGSGTTAICQNPTNGNIYLSFGKNAGLGYSNAIIEWDSSTNTHTEFTPGGSGAAILSGTPINNQHFGAACLGVDLKMYFVPWNNGNVMILNPADNTATGVAVTGQYSSATLGADGNIYAASGNVDTLGGSPGLFNSQWITIDTKPLSATYQTVTVVPVTTDSNVSYHVGTSTAISRSGKIFSMGVQSHTQGTTAGNITPALNTMQTNGEGWYEVNLNPYFNGQR
jgi:hypothetical protein